MLTSRPSQDRTAIDAQKHDALSYAWLELVCCKAMGLARPVVSKMHRCRNQNVVVSLRGVGDAATSKIRCDRCRQAYAKEYWTSCQRSRKKHRGANLVCQACRAQGFHAYDGKLRAYRCRMCAGTFGSKKISRGMRAEKKRERLGYHMQGL